MPRVVLKKDYKDGQILYGRELNLDNELTEAAININADELTDVSTKLDTIEEGAQVNKVETVNGIEPDTSKNIKIDKSDIGLGNVDNTSDISKPVSDLTKAYISEVSASKEEVNQRLLKDNINGGTNVTIDKDINTNNMTINVPSVEKALTLKDYNTSTYYHLFVGTLYEWSQYVETHPDVDISQYLIAIIEG